MDSETPVEKPKIISKINYWNDCTSNRRGEKCITDEFSSNKFFKYFNCLLSAAHSKKNKYIPKQFKNSRVKRIVAGFEKLNKNVKPNSSKTHGSKELDARMTDILNGLLEFQVRLRNDLNEIDWPSTIIATTTETHILSTNVIIS